MPSGLPATPSGTSNRVQMDAGSRPTTQLTA